MPILNQGDFIEDEKFGSGRVIYTKGNDALVEYSKSAPHQLLPGVWSVGQKMTIRRNDGTTKRVPDTTSFGREDHCQWYNRSKNNLRVVVYPDRIKKADRNPKVVVNQQIKGNNNIQAAGDIVVNKA